jgi:hypothetical protein
MSKISDEIVLEILVRIKKGESPIALAEEYGIGLTTIKRWRRGTQRVSKGFDPEKTINFDSAKRIRELEDKVEGLTLLLEDALIALKKQKK